VGGFVIASWSGGVEESESGFEIDEVTDYGNEEIGTAGMLFEACRREE